MPNPFTRLKQHPIQAGVLSFMLPGLGQLYQRRLVAAVPFFLFFIVLLWSDFRLWIVVPMAVAAWDAQRIPAQKLAWDRRIGFYFIVATIAFFASFALLSERVVGQPAMGKMGYTADALAESIQTCGIQRNAMPSTIADCAGLRWGRDPWGQPYAYVLQNAGFEIRSLGRDGVTSEDDFVFRYHFPASLRTGAMGRK